MPATLAAECRKLLATPESAWLGPGPRPGVLSEASLERQWAELAGRGMTPTDGAGLLRALILLWHDHFDSAHAIVQASDKADAAFVHGILHRREPDFGNAAYWFRRVGTHICFAGILKGVVQFAEREGAPSTLARLLVRNLWDPIAFIDACEEAASLPTSSPEVRWLRGIQRIETEVLAAYLCG